MVWAAVLISVLGGGARLASTMRTRALPIVADTLSVLPDCASGSFWLSPKECFGGHCRGPKGYALLEWSAVSAKVSLDHRPPREIDRDELAALLIDATQLDALDGGPRAFFAGGMCDGAAIYYRHIAPFELVPMMKETERAQWPELIEFWLRHRGSRAERLFGRIIELSQ